MLRKIVTSVPNLLTCCNLLCGALACIFSFSAYQIFPDLLGLSGRQIVWILIGAAAVFDFFDGAAARWLHAPSPLGKELDSLADLVSFGMAPAMLMYNILTVWAASWWIPYVALMMVSNMRMFSLKLKNFRIGDNLMRYILLLGAVVFVAGFGVEGFAYTIILYVVLAMINDKIAAKR